MPIFVPVDNNLVEEARQLGRHKTKKATVTAALLEYIRRNREAQELEVRGTFPHDPEFDYKTQGWNAGEGTV